MSQDLQPTKFFAPGVVELKPRYNAKGEQITMLTNPTNRSLELAQREDFEAICGSIRWGTEDRNMFGELLRGAVENFLPQNRFQLTLLRNIIAIQWQLLRTGEVQKSLFDGYATIPGKHGLPQGTHLAAKYQPEVSSLLLDLDRSINIYMKSKVKQKGA